MLFFSMGCSPAQVESKDVSQAGGSATRMELSQEAAS